MSHRAHGTRVKYVIDKCRCDDCREASRAAEAIRRRDRAYGIQSYIDAQPARDHVSALGQQGMGWKRVARTAGLSPSTVWKLMYGDPARGREPNKRIRPATAEAILSVELDLADGARIDGLGVARRLQALVALGWSMSKLADCLGVHPTNFTPIIHGRRDTTVGTDRAVRDLYDALSMTLPPESRHHEKSSATRARRYAVIAGWAPPLAWDDDALDDAAAVPDLGEQSKRDTVEDFDWLVEQGESPQSAAQIIGVTVTSIERNRTRKASVAA